MNYHATAIRIIQDLKCLLIGTEEGKLKIFSWPFDLSSPEKGIEKYLLSEISLHSAALNNLYITKNLKQIVTSSIDGSVILNKLMVLKNESLEEFDYFNEYRAKLAPNIERSFKVSDIHEYVHTEIKKKDQKAVELKKTHTTMSTNFETKKNAMIEDHQLEMRNLDEQVSIENLTFIYRG